MTFINAGNRIKGNADETSGNSVFVPSGWLRDGGRPGRAALAGWPPMLTEILTPEAQGGWHYWASVLLAHALIGAALFGVLRLVVRTGPAFAVVAVGYAIWELAQMILAGVWDWRDAATDWLAVMAGAAFALALMRRESRGIVAALAVLSMQAARGVRRRR